MKYAKGRKFASGRIKMIYKYIGRVFENSKLLGEIFSLKLDIEQMKKNHEKEIKLLEDEIKKLQISNETQIKRNEILRADNIGMYRMVKRYQKKLKIEEPIQRRVFKK